MPDPIVSRTDLSNYLYDGNRDLSANDMALAAVDAASDACRTTSGQVINLVEDEELTLDGSGTDVLLLPQQPVVSVASIIDGNDETVDDDDWTLTSVGTLVRPGGVWTMGRQNFTVTYTHGWSDEDIPRDIRMVALSMAGRIFMQGPVVFESIGKRQMRYAGPAMDFTKTELAILRKYKPT